MIIKEGSKLKIVEGNDKENALIDEIIANEDIEIEGNGEGYAILLRTEGHDANSIFESDKIYQVDKTSYVIYGYFKDALLIVKSKNYNPAMYSSYMDY